MWTPQKAVFFIGELVPKQTDTAPSFNADGSEACRKAALIDLSVLWQALSLYAAIAVDIGLFRELSDKLVSSHSCKQQTPKGIRDRTRCRGAVQCWQ